MYSMYRYNTACHQCIILHYYMIVHVLNMYNTTFTHTTCTRVPQLRQEMSNQLRRKRLSLDPQMMIASDRTRRLKGMERGSERRKRKALSDIFPNTQNEGRHIHVHLYSLHYMHVYIYIHVLMRDEKEERKKQSKVKQTTRQSNTAHTRQSLCTCTL